MMKGKCMSRLLDDNKFLTLGKVYDILETREMGDGRFLYTVIDNTGFPNFHKMDKFVIIESEVKKIED